MATDPVYECTRIELDVYVLNYEYLFTCMYIHVYIYTGIHVDSSCALSTLTLYMNAHALKFMYVY